MTSYTRSGLVSPLRLPSSSTFTLVLRPHVPENSLAPVTLYTPGHGSSVARRVQHRYTLPSARICPSANHTGWPLMLMALPSCLTVPQFDSHSVAVAGGGVCFGVGVCFGAGLVGAAKAR